MTSTQRVMPKPSLASAPNPLVPVTLVPEAMDRVSPGQRTPRAKDLNDAAWREIYEQVSTNAAVAARMVQIFEARPQLADSYPAVYLRAWITVERRNEQLARNLRIGLALRRWIKKPFTLFGLGTSSAMTSLSDIAAMPGMALTPSELGLRPTTEREAPSQAPAPAAEATGT
jgi:hypothetical protein